jgi:RES domain-containing protein
VDRSLAIAVARASTVTIEGTFQRHASLRYRTLSGSAAGGRWGPQGAFPVFYLARPTASVIVEAYRHLVEPVEGMRPELVAPRRLLTCEVRVTMILDLRTTETSARSG